MSSRRLFLAMAGALCVAPRVTAQERTRLIGCIPGGPMKPREHQWAAFQRGLRELGYVEGRNIRIEYRIPPGEGLRADSLITELVKLKVEVIVLSTAFHAQEAKKITQTVPIVLTGTSDPVATGLVASLARPGGNITGSSLLSVDLNGKRLEILKELLPDMKRVAMLYNPNDPSSAPQLKAARTAGRSAGVEVIDLGVKAANELPAAIDAATKQRAEGLLVATSGLFYGLRDQIMSLSQKARLPDIWSWGSFGGFGALLVYGPSDTENYRRAATYVDRILKGAKPQDLPIEQATSVEFVVNLRTAKLLGIKIPQSFLQRATRVIE